MKTMKKIGALAVALLIIVVMAVSAFAAETSVPSITINKASGTGEDTTEYTWYRIFEADIEEDPSGSPEQSGGKVAYYVTTQDRATQIEGTNLFNVVKVGTEDKWYVELKEEDTTAQDIIDAFGKMDLTKFVSGTFSQSGSGTATSGEVAPGYYYVTSTLGSNIVLQTLTAVVVNEKNTYITDDKVIAEADKNAEIGKPVTYTLTVNVPPTANDKIVLTDTLSKGLTYSGSTMSHSGTLEGPFDGTSGSTYFTIEWTADQVKAMTSGTSGITTITITVTAKVNKDALIDTGIPNTLDLTYGNNYNAVPKKVETQTTKFTFDKIDGASGTSGTTRLTGAEFMLTRDGSSGSAIPLVVLTSGTTYRIATDEDAVTTKTIVTNGNIVTINGLDADETYKLLETKAPTGYNKLENPITLETTSGTSGTTFVHMDVKNNKGTVLPSTGGIGTTILYIAGAILVLGAGILLVTKRRMGN